MYKPHMDATYIPTDLEGVEVKLTPNERYAANPDETATRPLPLFSSTASMKDGKLHVSMSNVKLNEAQTVTVKLDGIKAKKVSGKILTSDKASNYTGIMPPKEHDPVFPYFTASDCQEAGHRTLKG